MSTDSIQKERDLLTYKVKLHSNNISKNRNYGKLIKRLWKKKRRDSLWQAEKISLSVKPRVLSYY